MADELTAWDLLGGKISVPGDMRTAEWAMVPQWLRERMFYMAGVHRAEILQAFRFEVGEIAAGRLSVEESRKRLEGFLAAVNYQPLPGQEGTIKDLRTMRRIQVSLRTNVRLLQGWSRKERGLRPGALRAFPGWELVRFEGRKVPRNWQQRFDRAGGRIVNGRLIALKTSIVWRELGNGDQDSMGVDYPPFAWGSGMGWKPVAFSVMKKLGYLDGYEFPEAMPVRSPNESMEILPRVSERQLRDAMTDHLKGLAEWRGSKLLLTDPNGTRPMTPEALGELWKREMPDDFGMLPGGGQMQREAFLDWVADSNRYWNDPASGEFRAGGLNQWEDFQRVLMRLQPDGSEAGEMFRGLSWNNNKAFSEFMAGLERDGYSPRSELPAESWAGSLAAAKKYSDGNYRVILRMSGGHSAGRNIAPLVRAFWSDLAKREVPQDKLALTDNEIILPSWARTRVKSISKLKETANGKLVEIELEEVKP